MKLKKGAEKVECLLEALYPDIFPAFGTDYETVENYSLAVRWGKASRKLAGGFQERIEGILDGLARPPAVSDERMAVDLYQAISRNKGLWTDALALVHSCDAWVRGRRCVGWRNRPARPAQDMLRKSS